MRYTLLTQVALITISLVIVFAFIKPSFAELTAKQDEHFLYEDAVSKAEELNRELQSLIARRDAFSENDRYALESFIPAKIDSLKVMRDLEGIFTIINKPLLSLTSQEVIYPRTMETNDGLHIEIEQTLSTHTSYQDFDVVFVGSYFDIKEVLRMIEKNETLLELVRLNFNPVDSAINDESREEDLPAGQFKFEITLRAFGLATAPQ